VVSSRLAAAHRRAGVHLLLPAGYSSAPRLSKLV
jgi:hypothetical protein